MKKSKIIAPALGVLVLSTAAAVTGTVAWFTATRVRNVGMNGISAVNPEQGLKLTYAQSVYSSPVTIEDTSGGNHYTAGTGAVEEGAAIRVTHKQLRDASVNMSASDPAVFGSVLDETSGELSGVAAKNFQQPDSKQYGGQDVYFATAFELRFSVDRVESGYKQHLLLDQGKSSITAPTEANDANSIKKALRIGFKTSGDWFVWAPFTSDTVGTTAGVSLRYVTSATAPNPDTLHEGTTAFYNESQIIIGNDAAGDSSYAADTEAVGSLPVLATVQGYLGYLGELSDTSDLSVKVVTWFEGTDSKCVNEATALAQEFSANLQFCMRKSKNA